MDPIKVNVVNLKKRVLEDNDNEADLLRSEMKKEGTYYINIMSSPGSGKTTTIEQLIRKMKDEFKIGVMEADIDGDVDARRIASLDIPQVQLHTGGMCHLDADMSRQGLASLGVGDLDIVILENVGNLVCPAEFDTGAAMNMVILSIPEGDDKPLKYPLMFSKADVVIANKMDTLPVFDFDMEKFASNVKKHNEEADIFPVSALTGEGFDELCAYLRDEVVRFKEDM